MQNRSIFPYRRHGPKKRVKHGANRKERGPRKGLPNSARDLLPLLQPATKALAQVLAGRAGASGQLGHARTMLAQAERMIAERAHNRLTPAEREEFFEQLARLKLTLADADAEAEVQAVEQHEPKPQAAPVAQERLKEMALALTMRDSGRERSGQAEGGAPAGQAATEREIAAPAGAGSAEASEEASEEAQGNAAQPSQAAPAVEAGSGTTGQSGSIRGRLVLPKASADQAVQALALGSLARRRSRASNRAADAAFSVPPGARAGAERAPEHGADEAAGRQPEDADRAPRQAFGAPAQGFGDERSPGSDSADTRAVPADEPEENAASPDDDEAAAAEPHHGNGATLEGENASSAKKSRRGRKPKRQGLPEGWVIDEEGFVVPGAG